MRDLTGKELVEINGGHDGAAYQFGKFIGRMVVFISTLGGIKKIRKMN